VGHSREQIAFTRPQAPHSLNEAIQEESSQSVLFLDSSQSMTARCFFSIREVTSVTMSDVPPALTDVLPEAQVLMTACEGAMTTISCANTESDAQAHDSANATFEEAASQLEELGYSHEISSDGVLFSRESVVVDYGPSATGSPLLLFSSYMDMDRWSSDHWIK
jgi:hypothetical protein